MKMSSTSESSQDDEISPPLFVRIQTIDLSSLDFQTNIGSAAKFRHLTYVEATNIFLFMGSTSGSVYVFSRDTLKFLFIIPFKGGKVCNIACSQDESDIAVGSIRGKVSIYRISPTVHYMQSSASAPLIDAFRDICDVPHHVGSEITELQWSPNGKYLFVGDSQGIVSQMDVACLEEFPRPVPSKIILKLQSRVLQIDCSFPYLAVCTLTAVFLCDLEKEDFTRVQCTKCVDILSTGISLMILPERCSLRDLGRENAIPSAKLILYIGEPRSGFIHCCNMEGNVQVSKKVQISSQVTKHPMLLFDPTKPATIPEIRKVQTGGDAGENGLNGEGMEEAESVSISLGKMLCTDDGMIVSVSNDRLYVYDPYTLNVIAWNEDFKRINNFKIISNYAFIWTGNKLEVVAFTPFRSYAEQLFRAKLIDVLESWIVHTLYALGWRLPIIPALDHKCQESTSSSGSSNGECTAKESHQLPSLPQTTTSSSISVANNLGSEFVPSQNNKSTEMVVYNFRKMMFSESEEQNDFTRFVDTQLPFPLVVQETPPDNPVLTSDNFADTYQNPQIVDECLIPSTKALEQPIQIFLSEVESALQILSLKPSQHAPSCSSSTSSLSDNHLHPSGNVFVANNNDNSRILLNLSQTLKACRNAQSDICVQFFTKVWKALLTFYESIECSLPQLDYKKSDITLPHVLSAAQSFLCQPKFFILSKEIGEVCDISKFEQVIIQLISCLYCQQSQFLKLIVESGLKGTDLSNPSISTISSTEFTLCFTKFAQCPLVIQWFRECGTSPATLFYDGLVADTVLLLFPLLQNVSDTEEFTPSLISHCLESIGIYEKLPKYFMTWLTLCQFLPKKVPYSPLLRSLLNEQLFEKLAEEMFSTIYRDFKLSSFGNAVHYLHHFVSALVLLSKSPVYGQPRTVQILLSCFPLKQWAKEDIVTKIIAACHLNPCLLGLYLKACVEDGNSLRLCACGIQAGYGSLEGKITSWQRSIEEAIMKLLLEEYFKSSPYEEEEVDNVLVDGNGNSTQKRRTEMLVHIFAMRRGVHVLDAYFRSPLPDEFLSDTLQAEIIVRSGSCLSLKYFYCDEEKMNLLLKSYENNFEQKTVLEKKSEDKHIKNPNGLTQQTNGQVGKKLTSAASSSSESDRKKYNPKCKYCSGSMHRFNHNFKPFSKDCLGLWAVKQLGGNLERFIQMIHKCNLNNPRIFSARFYAAVAKLNDEAKKDHRSHNYDFDFAGETSTSLCNAFHE